MHPWPDHLSGWLAVGLLALALFVLVELPGVTARLVGGPEACAEEVSVHGLALPRSEAWAPDPALAGLPQPERADPVDIEDAPIAAPSRFAGIAGPRAPSLGMC